VRVAGSAVTVSGVANSPDLAAGYIILGIDGTQTVVSNETEQHPQGVPVYNLEVEEAHTYFVLAAGTEDADAVWVHNASYVSARPTAGSTVVRTSRGGEKAIRITYPDGRVVDISPTRVKEFVPNTHPKAPAGALQKVQFDDALPGSKGFKRAPTAEELRMLEEAQ
jgi:hypothetical protein